MSDIVRYQPEDSVPEIEPPRVVGLENFPPSVREIFSRLTDSLRAQIVGTTQPDFSRNSKEGSLEDVVASFDTEKREEFMMICLMELFRAGQIKERLLDSGLDNLHLEIKRFMDMLWQNRGHHSEDELVIFNQDYYQRFYKERAEYENNLQLKIDEINALKQSIDITRKQKRLTEIKREKLRLLETEKDILFKQLQSYDQLHHNSDTDHWSFRDVKTRSDKEREWTKAVSIASEYFDPTEFSTVITEQLGYAYIQEKRAVDSEKKDGQNSRWSREFVIRAQIILDACVSAVEEWYVAHDSDETYKQKPQVKMADRQIRLIKYLKTLIYSYEQGQQRQQSDEELVSTVRQIEIVLSTLLKNQP